MNNPFQIVLILYVAIVASPAGEVIKVAKPVDSYKTCLKIKQAQKNPEYNFIHEACHVVQIPVPNVLNNLPPVNRESQEI